MRRWFLAALGGLLLAGQAAAADWQKVVAPGALHAMAAEVVVLDIRDPEAYAGGHVPGALNAPYGSWRGPADNPGGVLSDAALTERLQSLGLTGAERIAIAYPGEDETQFGAAARVYWTLKSAGFSEIAVLNGGLAAWSGAGLPLETGAAPAIAPSEATFALSEAWMIDRDGVQAILDGTRDAVMIDARPAAFWKGETKHNAAAEAGTLEGALNITHDTWFGPDRTEILSAAAVRERAAKAGYTPGKEVVSFCNTGHWAATNWFALSELAGIEGVRLYPESMVGWTNAGGRVWLGQ